MKICIFGPGAIGSTFAYRLALAGHDVTVVARGTRLARLQRDGAIELVTGERAPVRVVDGLEEAVAFDLVLVTVLATQVEAILPTLRKSRARNVMFMFNTFDSIDTLAEAVGKERFSFGFPGGIFTLLIDGKVRTMIRAGTTVGDAEWAKVFGDAGIPTVTEVDMQSWLRTHAAMIAPLMATGVIAHNEGRGLTWSEARRHARALDAGFEMVRSLGNTLRPSALAALAHLPTAAITALVWSLSRTTMLRELGGLGATEPRMLIDMMARAAPQLAAPVLAIRP